MAKYYESDITRMMRDMLKEKPHIRDEQQKGRDLWWDKSNDPDTLRRMGVAKVPQSPYAYQVLPKKA